jgi:5-methylcytosine-specific restriction enzyme subunit McrC
LQGPIKHALTDERGTERFKTRPDIVISRAGRPLLIIDTKWKRLAGVIDDAKRGVGQADVCQMMAYAQVYECDRVMLLYPHHGEIGDDAGRLSRHRIVGTDDSIVTVASVGLVDIGTVGAALRALVSPDLTIHHEHWQAAA